jgi:membrane protease YdiL (CAAX protease family)
MAANRIFTALLVTAATLAPVVWELIVGVAIMLTRPLPELQLLAAAKIGFAVVLLLGLWLFKEWRACGFLGGLQWQGWSLLWPIWLAAFLSGLQGFSETDPWRLVAWAAIALSIAIGEEGIFRGVLFALLDKTRPRRAVCITALLFGAIHLSGLASPLDWRMIVAQAIVTGSIGLVLGATRLLVGSIWPGIVVHATLDFMGLAAAGSVTTALEYEPAAVYYLLGSAVISAGWGLFLIRRLPHRVVFA